MNLANARDIADGLIALLRPGCARIEIAGSIRRECEYVNDVEVVAIANPDEGLFAPPDAPPSLDSVLERVLVSGALSWDALTPRNGPRYKRFVHPAGISVDLFLTAPDNWGNILTIRTGGTAFAHWLVTPRAFGGAMPTGTRQQDGALYRGDRMQACPTERDFFDALGVRWIEPKRRSGDNPDEWRGLLEPR